VAGLHGAASIGVAYPRILLAVAGSLFFFSSHLYVQSWRLHRLVAASIVSDFNDKICPNAFVSSALVPPLRSLMNLDYQPM
jgi:hypothetical protein